MRSGKAILAGLTTILLTTVSVTAADLMIEAPVAEEAANSFSLGVTGGVIAFNIPEFAAPIFGEDANGELSTELSDIFYGGLIGFSASVGLDEKDGYATSLGMSAFAAYASRSSSGSVVLEGDGYLFVPGITTPTGTITLLTDAPGGVDPTASADISGAGGMDQTVATPANAAGAQNAWGTRQNIPGEEFSLAGATTFNGADDTAAAYGALATTAGGVFLAVGDLTGLEITTEQSQELVYAGGDVTFAVASAPAENIIVQGYVGPSYRFMGQRMSTDISINIPEVEPVAPAGYEFPTYSQSTDEELDTHYLGGVAGGSMTMALSDTLSLTLGAELGLYRASSSYSASESYTLSGGDPVLSLGDQTIENLAGISETADGFAYSLRGQGTLTAAVAESMQISLGLGLEYLSRVASVSRDGTGGGGLTMPSADDATYTGPGAGASSSVAFGDMVNYTLTVSLTGQF